jgi:hypothetical protein
MADSRKSPGSRSSSTAGPSRLPSARERRPALAALAVLLIVGGAFASGWLALQLGNRESYLVLTTDVAPGEEITEEHVGEVELTEDVEGLVPADGDFFSSKHYARTRLLASTILSTGMVSGTSTVSEGQQVVAIPVEPLEMPSSLDEGGVISIIAATDPEDAEPAIYLGTVRSITRPDGDDSATSVTDEAIKIDVLVDESCLLPIATARDEDVIQVSAGFSGESTIDEIVDCREDGSGDDRASDGDGGGDGDSGNASGDGS